MSSYKTCSVPMCKNSTVTCPDKLFINVPYCPKRRKQWLRLARREFTSEKFTMYFCEDHFDLPNDMENYIRYTVMGSVGRIRMKPDCLPLKFKCQEDGFKCTAPSRPQPVISKRQHTRQELCSKEIKIPAKSGQRNNNCLLSYKKVKKKFQDQATQVCPETVRPIAKTSNKFIQVCMSARTAKNSFSLKPITTLATSPIKTMSSVRTEKVEVSSSSSSPSKPSVQSLCTMSTSSDQEARSELAKIKRKVEAENLHQTTIATTILVIKNKPAHYLGISKGCYFLIDIIKKNTALPEEHILLCLKKIKLNTPFTELGDQFGMTLSYVRKVFTKSIIIIASVLRPFIFKLNKNLIKESPHIHNCNNIYCVIDCIEIEIQKSSKSTEEALTWSEYKKANTAKYLISSTPDGIINYISPGYSGRITGDMLVQDCNFLDCLEPGVSILADIEFQNIEELLLQKGITLVRPPRVACDSQLSEEDALKTKELASLRINSERVLGHLREFSMLKPHSVVNMKLLKYLDECVIIACALINLQNSLNK